MTYRESGYTAEHEAAALREENATLEATVAALRRELEKKNRKPLGPPPGDALLAWIAAYAHFAGLVLAGALLTAWSCWACWGRP